MFKLSRLLLIIAVLAGAYSFYTLMGVAWPASGFLMGAMIFSWVIRRGYATLTTLGSARWASDRELRRAGMIGARSGLILGRRI
jgi:type IV secretory pathway TraG/TraD family ATPase VirD4